MDLTPPAGSTLGKLTFVFTDIEESVRATKALGDTPFRDKLLDPLHKRAIELIRLHHGELKRQVGDSYQITFSYADEALSYVVALQQSLADDPIACEGAPGERWTIRLRVGVHTSEAELSLDARNEFVGTDVNFAARIMSLGRGDQIIVSDSTYRAAGSRQYHDWLAWPSRRIKSFDDPEMVWELRWDGKSRGEPGSRWLPDWFIRDINKFVPRDDLMDAIREQLTGPSHLLLVLVGSPGIGKTRLAIQTVLGLCASFEAGVAFVPLADGDSQAGVLQSASGLASAIARAVKADSKVIADPEQALLGYLNSVKPEQQWLIILDGWEAVEGEETLAWLSRMVQGCRQVRWLITSAVQIDLFNLGESRVIPPMAIPPLEDDATETQVEVEALRLFRERVEQRGHSLPIDEASARAIRTILHQTEGHPLSIELAASWVGVRGLHEIAQLLREDPLKVLQVKPGGQIAGPARHQSIEKSLWWIVRLLPEDQSAALHRLANLPEVFDQALALAEQGLRDEWLIRWQQLGLLEPVESPMSTQYRLRRVVREYCRKIGPVDSSPRPTAFRTIEDVGSTLAELLACWANRDRDAWSKHIELYRRIAEKLLTFAETLVTLEVVVEGLGRWPTDLRLRQLHGLALARSGSVEPAWKVMADLYQEGNRDPETLGIYARTLKNRGVNAVDPVAKADFLRQSLRHYAQAFEGHESTWLGINAATVAVLLGDEATAAELARKVRKICKQKIHERNGPPHQLFYNYASLGEAELILGDHEEAADYYRRAVKLARGRFGDIKSTRYNARLLLALDRFSHARETIEAALKIPDVVIFVGHMIDRDDRPGREGRRFPMSLERRVARAIRGRLESMNALIGYASAACGSDILFLEELNDLKDQGAETHVVLPYDREAYVDDSVDIVEEGNWPARFEHCLNRAEVVTCSPRRLEFAGISYRFANLFLQGLATARAEELETGIRYLAVWDGKVGDGPGGTADTIVRWKLQKRDVEIIWLHELLGEPAPDLGWLHELLGEPAPDPDPSAVATRPPTVASGPPSDEPGMRIMAVLFARVVGFETLVESQFLPFVEDFLGLIAQRLDDLGLEPLKRNSWGNGIFLAFNDIRDAGRAALDLSSSASRMDWTQFGLPAGLSLRVGLHAGPVFYGRDPITKQNNPIGDHVARASAIEAATRVGRACASREFAALAAAEQLPEFGCHYLGLAPSASGGEPIPIYEVRAKPTATEVDREAGLVGAAGGSTATRRGSIG